MHGMDNTFWLNLLPTRPSRVCIICQQTYYVQLHTLGRHVTLSLLLLLPNGSIVTCTQWYQWYTCLSPRLHTLAFTIVVFLVTHSRGWAKLATHSYCLWVCMYILGPAFMHIYWTYETVPFQSSAQCNDHAVQKVLPSEIISCLGQGMM